MIDVLSGIGYGIIGFAVIIVIGIVVIGKLGESVGGTGNTTAVSIIAYLGTSGLAGWIPAVIAVAIGGLFMVYFGSKKAY